MTKQGEVPLTLTLNFKNIWKDKLLRLLQKDSSEDII